MISAEKLSITRTIHDVPFCRIVPCITVLLFLREMGNMAADLNVFEVGYMLEQVEERIERPG